MASFVPASHLETSIKMSARIGSHVEKRQQMLAKALIAGLRSVNALLTLQMILNFEDLVF